MLQVIKENDHVILLYKRYIDDILKLGRKATENLDKIMKQSAGAPGQKVRASIHAHTLSHPLPTMFFMRDVRISRFAFTLKFSAYPCV